MEDKITILKVLVGSHAHGLNDKNSDKDYRGVFIYPTSKILSLGYNYKSTSWIEGNEDNTAYELEHFLSLATKSNPTILEVFKAPVVENNEDAYVLRELFPYIWNPKDAFNAFTGYGYNQRKKFLEKKDNRQDKYAVAYVRVLLHLNELLVTGDFSVEIKNPLWRDRLLRFKKGEYTPGEVIDVCENLVKSAEEALPKCNQVPDLDRVNDFLLKMRQKYFYFTEPTLDEPKN